MNCTGLGAGALFGDSEITPVKGLLVLLPPQAEVQYATSGGVNIPQTQRGLFVHMMPRTDGIVLGGTTERGVGTFDVNEDEKRRIVETHIALFAAMRQPGAPAAPARR